MKNLYNVNIKLISKFLLFIFIFTLISIRSNTHLVADESSKKNDMSYYDYSEFDLAAQNFVRKLSLHPEEEFLAQYKPSYNRHTSLITELDLFKLLSSENVKEFVVHLGYTRPYLYPSYVIHNTRDIINKHNSDSVHLVHLSSYKNIDDNFSSLFVQALHGVQTLPSQRFIGIITKLELDKLSEEAHDKIFSLFDHIIVLESINNTLHYSTLGKAIEIAASNPNNLSTTVYLKEGGLKEFSGIINSLARLAYPDYTVYHNVHYILQTGFNPRSLVDEAPVQAASMIVADFDKISTMTENASFTIKYHEEPSYFSLFYNTINSNLYLPINLDNTLKKYSLAYKLLASNPPEFNEIEVNNHKNSYILKKIKSDLDQGISHFDNESAKFIAGADSGIFLLRQQEGSLHNIFVQIIFSKALESWVIFSNKAPITLNINGTSYDVPYSNLKEVSSDFLSLNTTIDISSLGIDPTEPLRISAILHFIPSEKNTTSESAKLLLKFLLSDQHPVLKAHSDITNYFINKAFYFRLLEIQDQLSSESKYTTYSVLNPNMDLLDIDSDYETHSYIYNLKYTPTTKFPLRMKNRVFENKQSFNEYLTVATSYLYNETRSFISKINIKLNSSTSTNLGIEDFLFKRNCSDFFM